MNVHPTFDRMTLTHNLRHDSRQFETCKTFFQTGVGVTGLLRCRRASEFAAPDHERGIKQATLLQIAAMNFVEPVQQSAC